MVASIDLKEFLLALAEFLVGYVQEDNEVEQKLAGFRIWLDEGHGGKDSGAVGHDGTREHDLNMWHSNLLEPELVKLGAEVFRTQRVSRDIEPSERIRNINDEHKRKPLDLCVSIHHNAFGDPQPNGITTYHHGTRQGIDKRWAEIFHVHLVAKTGANDRGVKTGNFYMVRDILSPAILLELGFMTNPVELERMKTQEYRDKLVKACVEAIIAGRDLSKE